MNNLKKLRTEKNISQSALCEQLKEFNCFIERSTYSKYETGSREMSAGILMIFADYFGVTVDFISEDKLYSIDVYKSVLLYYNTFNKILYTEGKI